MKAIRETQRKSFSEVAEKPLKGLNSSQHSQEALHFATGQVQVQLLRSIKQAVFGSYLPKPTGTIAQPR